MQMIALAAAVLAAAFLIRVEGAVAETKILKLRHIHSGAEATIAYKRDGRYLPEGLKRIDALFADWRTKRSVTMDPHLLDLLWEVHRRSGARGPVAVIGGYRSPATNKMLRSRSKGVAKDSQHTRGKAIDFFIPGVPLQKIREIALTLQGGGVGYYPKSGSPFVHLDVGKARYWPRMSRRQLMALFPDGNSVYLPADGKPLPGYRQALATQAAHRRAGTLPGGVGEKNSGARRTLLAFLTGRNSMQETLASKQEPPIRAAALVQESRPPREIQSEDILPVPIALPLDAPRRVPIPLWRAYPGAAELDVAPPLPVGAPPRRASLAEITGTLSAQSLDEKESEFPADGIGILMASLPPQMPAEESRTPSVVPVPLPRPGVIPNSRVAPEMLRPPETVLVSRFELAGHRASSPGFAGRAVHFSPIAWTSRQDGIPSPMSVATDDIPKTGLRKADD